MKNSFKALCAIALSSILAGSAVSFAGCGKKREGYFDEETGIAHLVFAGRSNAQEEANYRTFIADFMEENPDFDVTIEWYPSEIAYNQALSGKGKNLPDLFMLSDNMFIQYAEAGLITDYKEFVNMDELNDTIYNYAAEAYCYNTRTNLYGWNPDDADCGFYGYPKDQGPLALCYNKELFQELLPDEPLPSPTDPYTFNEFLEVNKKLKNAYETQHPGQQFFPVAEYNIDCAVYCNNAEFFDETATTAKIDEPNFIQSIEFLQSLYTQGVMALPSSPNPQGQSSFINGTAVFFDVGPWFMKDFALSIQFEWDIAPFCVGPAEGAMSVAYTGSMGYCISSTSKVKEYAAYLAKYLATSESSNRTQYARGQAIPNCKSLAEEFINDSRGLMKSQNINYPESRGVWIDVIDGFGTQKTDANGNTYTDIITGKYRPDRFTYTSGWHTKLNDMLNGKYSGIASVWAGGSAEDACRAYKAELQAQLDDMAELRDQT